VGRELTKNERDRDDEPIMDRSQQSEPGSAPPKWHAPQISILAFSFTAMAGLSGTNFDSTTNYS
jgi:hypothetical protein